MAIAASPGSLGARMGENEIGQWQAADAIFDGLLQLPESERGAALMRMSLDADVRRRVERLLEADRGTRTLSAAGQGPLFPTAAAGALPGRRIGRWMIESEIGRGGMSVVYRAHAVDAPERIAALKLLTLGALAGPGAERFRREQAILARLNHPHIATLLDAGIADDGTPWIAMVLVDGLRIDQWCEQHDLDLRERVRLFLEVCAAVAHAHRSLVVHRDLKPSNILVDGEGHVRLLDFGIARLLDDTLGENTATHWRALSPSYAAPEQFSGTAQSTAIDVFGLGAVLYTLLTGQPPRTPGSTAPARMPSSAAPAAAAAAGDLDAIVMKALGAEPADRYATVNALSEDLQHWLAGEPISARHATLRERATRFARRNGLPLALAAAALVFLVGGSVVAWDQAREARAQATSALAARAEAIDSLDRASALRDYLIGIFETQSPGKPRSELPSTAELLDEGERLALSSTVDNAGVRADMLDAITQVRLARSDAQHAGQLVERTLGLADSMGPAGAAVRARALMRRSIVERIDRNYEKSMASLEEARGLLAGITAQPLATDVELAMADTLLAQRRFDDALSVLRPLLEAGGSTPASSARQRRSLFGSMAIALSGRGQVRDSLPFRERALEETRQQCGDGHFRVALGLNNVSIGNRQIGAFEASERQAREAIAIYDEVLEGQSEYRGSAHVGLGLLQLARGRFDEAVEELDRGNRENAAVRGIARAEDYDFFQWNRGIALAQAGRRDEAIAALTRAESALALRPAPYAQPVATAAAWLAIVHCGHGDVVPGEASRSRMHAALATLKEIAPAESATYAEADARCSLASGDAVRAQRELAPALVSDANLEPGFAADTARRQELASEIAYAMKDFDAAASHVRFGIEQLAKAGLDAHPLHARLVAAADRR